MVTSLTLRTALCVSLLVCEHGKVLRYHESNPNLRNHEMDTRELFAHILPGFLQREARIAARLSACRQRSCSLLNTLAPNTNMKSCDNHGVARLHYRLACLAEHFMIRRDLFSDSCWASPDLPAHLAPVLTSDKRGVGHSVCSTIWMFLRSERTHCLTVLISSGVNDVHSII